jgi:DNA-binding GntR family transcriptional regulator
MRLRPEQIAAEIGVSRMPVREAVRQLHAEGLLTTMPNRGVVVSRRSAEEVVELFEIRAALEGLAAGLAAPAMTDDALMDLEHVVAQMRRAEHDPPLWLTRHEVFHAQICALSGRERLAQLAGQMRLQCQPYLRLFAFAGHVSELVDTSHEVIVDALRTGDAATAEAAMRAHVPSQPTHIAQSVCETADD